jgi:hypothetical protein
MNKCNVKNGPLTGDGKCEQIVFRSIASGQAARITIHIWTMIANIQSAVSGALGQRCQMITAKAIRREKNNEKT